MDYRQTAEQLESYRRQIAELRKQMRAAQAAGEPEKVAGYTFTRADGGTLRLSDLFGDKDTLLVIHNMGTGCIYCTLWADGFNGVYDHLRNRAGFVVSSPDAPAQQQKFAASRGWTFPMISYQGTTFGEDMGYRIDGQARPGVSVFRRNGGKILRVADTGFQPGDDFCSVWHFFDLIPEGAAGWQPKFRY
jgi:predicted dithiol-disulfide oxidoreductase (DUF899 family)